MRRDGEVTVASNVTAAAGDVWARVTTPEGINHELMPIMRMTVPRGLNTLDINTLPVGEPIGRSWIKLFGLIPVDYDDLCLIEVEPGRRFLERSSMLMLDRWEHERSVEPGESGCTVRDRLVFHSRVPVPARMIEPIVRALFRHRHRRLRKHFDGPARI